MNDKVDVLATIDHCRTYVKAEAGFLEVKSYDDARAAVSELIIELKQSVVQLEMAAECIEAKRYDEALLHASSLMRSKRQAIARAKGEA
ncbi:hypothetical protein BRC2024_HCTLARHO_CDS_0007 [Acinetobacter phage vB_AbaS_Silvergun]